MNVEEKAERVCEAWRTAANALSIRIEAPYLVKTTKGKKVLCVAHLPDFGGLRGMMIGLTGRAAYAIDNDIKSAAESQGLFYTFINTDVYERYDEEIFKEALADWGFFGNEDRRPGWLQKPTKNE